jgi:transposase
MLLTEGQMSDHKGAALLLPALPPARELLGDRGYDSNRFRTALTQRGIAPCIPSTRTRKVPIPHDTVLYRQRHRVENMFGRLKPVLSLPKGTATCPHPLRPLRAHLLLGHQPRRNRHLLAATMSPDPRSKTASIKHRQSCYVSQRITL